MRPIFADTFYWVALINPNDDWHDRVRDYSQTLEAVTIITIDEVLTEVLTFYAESGPRQRQRAISLVDNILANSHTKVIPQSHESFLTGLDLYRNRLDKGYSLTDCISMATMRQQNITAILTHDHHFTQEGFSILLN